MEAQKPVRIFSIRSEEKEPQTGQLTIQSWEKSTRTKRALKASGLCFGLAVITVFLPIVHFFLVPAFLIATPIAGWFFWTQESVVLGGQGLCPECGKEFRIERGPNRFPMDDVCNHCKAQVRIELGLAGPAEG